MRVGALEDRSGIWHQPVRLGQPAQIDAAMQRSALDAVAGYYKELGLPAPEPVNAPYAPDLDAQLDAVAEIRPRVFTVHLNDLNEKRIKSFKGLGILIGGQRTCVAEAHRLESLGFDFVIAQGGRSRGSSRQLPARSLPVAHRHAGARAPGRTRGQAARSCGRRHHGRRRHRASFALGAQLAQLGTAFVPCRRAARPRPTGRAAGGAEDDTRITEKFSGKPARGLANRFVAEMAASNAPQLAFPAQNAVTGKLRQASAKAGKPDFIALWAGQAVSFVASSSCCRADRQAGSGNHRIDPEVERSPA
jgi:nitronate monooxygenase